MIETKPAHQRVNVMGVNISAVNIPTAVEVIGNFIADDARTYVTVTSVHGVVESQHDAELMAIHNRSGMSTPDGMPLVWCCQKAGVESCERTYGPDLMLALCEESARKGWTNYLYGAGPGVAEELGNRLSSDYPGFKVLGTHCPPFRPLTEEEDEAIIAEINNLNPDIVWVGLSTPKQEWWMDAHVNKINARVMIGVGAAFDFHSGNTKQAPKWMQTKGLEWLFRLVTEPKRLWKRYLLGHPQFVWGMIKKRPKIVQ